MPECSTPATARWAPRRYAPAKDSTGPLWRPWDAQKLSKLSILIGSSKSRLEPGAPSSISGITLSIEEPKHPFTGLRQSGTGSQSRQDGDIPCDTGDTRVAHGHRRLVPAALCVAQVPLGPARHILPANGTREALFAVRRGRRGHPQSLSSVTDLPRLRHADA